MWLNYIVKMISSVHLVDEAVKRFVLDIGRRKKKPLRAAS
jgi:hypothetical protein